MINKLIRIWCILCIFSLNTTFAEALPGPLFTSIGNGGFKADTQNELAQKYFNQGMVFFYGFDFLEAVRSFESSLQLDKDCSRCQFALALSLGSITNAFIKGDEIERAKAILDKAKGKDPVTQGLLAALDLRYQDIPNTIIKKDYSKNTHCAQGEINLPYKNKLAFSNALFDLVQKYPEFQTLKALFAYSIIGTENWIFYDGLQHPRPYTQMMINACQQILRVNPKHIGAIHYLIHATEWSSHPAQSLPYAKNLPSYAPLAEHLVHMPSHIYLRLGDNELAIKQNQAAIAAYNQYAAQCQHQGFKPVTNFLTQHNYDYLFTSALLAGRADIAFDAADSIRKITPLDWLSKQTFFQRFYALKLYAIAHFGQWQQLRPLEEPLQKYPYLKAINAYLNGLHALAMHQTKEFNAFYKEFVIAAGENNLNPDRKKLFANNLSIAKHVLLGNRERYLGRWEKAIYHWSSAAGLQSAGGDPPDWYFPTSLGLGYTFLDAKKYKQAIATFETSLASNPENGWALFGLSTAYEGLGQLAKAQLFKDRFRKVWKPEASPLPISQGSDLFVIKRIRAR